MWRVHQSAVVVSFAPELRISPAVGVLVEGNRWVHRELGHSIPIPPTVIVAESSDSEVLTAHSALLSGLAVATYSGPRTLSNFLRAEARLPLRPTNVVAVPKSVLNAIFSVVRVFVRALSLPLVIFIVGALAGLFIRQPVIVHGCFVALLIPVSILVHELGHIVAFRILAPTTPGLFVMTRISPRLVRPEIAPVKDIAVSLAGPCAPVLVLGFASPFVFQSPAEFIAFAILAVSHIMFIFMPHGDGAALRSAKNRMQESRARQGSCTE